MNSKYDLKNNVLLVGDMASSSGTKVNFSDPPRRRTRQILPRANYLLDDDDAIVDSELVPSSLASVVPVLRVANDIEKDNPRVAYLCRFHALEKAIHMDPTSSGRGVGQFKTYLIRRLEREETETKHVLARNDPKEITIFYQRFYELNIRDGEYTKKPEEMAKNCQVATVLYEVLRAVVPSHKIDPQTQRYAEEVARKSDQYAHYNILPLFAVGVKPAIMELPGIKAAVCALRNLENIPMPRAHTERVVQYIGDILDWVSSIFGFQKGSVANQREHLILLLANIDVRRNSSRDNYPQLSSSTVKTLGDKIFQNYRSWCKYLDRSSNIRFPMGPGEQQVELIYIALYLLIWGEASSIRFMPECLCYIFHHMASELFMVLMSNDSLVRGDVYQFETRDEEHFLRTIIVPIFGVLHQEAKKSRRGNASYSNWRNYDDMNEYFWSQRCFRLGWPMDFTEDFFMPSNAVNSPDEARILHKRKPKMNFVEVRTFLHLYRNFDRMWKFFILAFQVMVIVAWNSSGSIADCFNEDVFKSVLSIFVTSAFSIYYKQSQAILQLTIFQALMSHSHHAASLDIVLSLKAWKSLKSNQIMRYVLKFVAAAFWAVIMPLCYFHSELSSAEPVRSFNHWTWRNHIFTYIVAVYSIPNLLNSVLFILPPLRRAVECSNWRIIGLLMWWAQPKLYVGRGMHEDMLTLLKYTLFWVVLLIFKLGFSYYVEISPLVAPTKLIMEMSIDNYEWHEFFPHAWRNIFLIIAIWAPIVLVYLMDTQIWFAIFSTLLGGIQGAFGHLGEIRTLGMLKSRFGAVSLAFSRYLMPSSSPCTKNRILNPSVAQNNISRFYLFWNEFINSMRSEDFLSNRDRDLLVFPQYSHGVSVVQWPPFIVSSKISVALNIAKHFKGKSDDGLFRKIKSNDYMETTVIEFYEILRDLIHDLLECETDKMIVKQIFNHIETSARTSGFVNNFRLSELLRVSERLEKFLNLLLVYDEEEEEENVRFRIITALQDVLETVTQDFMINGHAIFETIDHRNAYYHDVTKEPRFSRINMSLRHGISWKEKVRRLHLLLTVNESAINGPRNLEARRRITFFANSLFMNMPHAPELRDMFSFSVLTPYYKEDVLYTEEELNRENEDGISILFYLQKIYPDEWKNFEERISDPNIYNPDDKTTKELIRQWASCRAQTLHRTMRGMMNYRHALEFQSLLESVVDTADFGGSQNSMSNEKAIRDRAQALVDLKFTYVVSCQVYGLQKKSNDHRDQVCYSNILKLMLMYPSMRVAYIDSREEMVDGQPQTVYYSVLVKGGYKLDEEIYRIKLPGSPTLIGEAKPENQNNAIIFTRGEALQTIDMNQDNYFEEAFKMRNVLEEFIKPRQSERKPTILGLREHIFTGSISSVAQFMCNQETTTLSLGKRILANPLRVRFHYGHPDIFDRIFHITRGGIGKASRGLNLVEDIFAGYNSTLRGGFITYHEYIQVGKGRDSGMNQISIFEAKVANGNGEQTLTRDVYRLGCRFDFFRMLSFYFTTVGFYFSCMVTVLTIYAFLYGRLYMVMSGAEEMILKNPTIRQTEALEQALVTQSLSQLGLLSLLPMAMEIGLEKGVGGAIGNFVINQLQLASVFFAFQLGTKVHYYGRTILHGGSTYRAVGSGLVIYRARFAEIYRLYSRSHFVKGLEIFLLLIVYKVYGGESNNHGSSLYSFVIFSMWFIASSWLLAPFLFNPSGFDLRKVADDWTDWKRWMASPGGVGILPDRSWESWWNEEWEHLRYTNIRGRVLEIFLACRFFIYQYGIVYHLDISHRSKSLQVYGLSWVFVATVLLALKMVSIGRRRFGLDFQLIFRILKAHLFLGFVSAMAILFAVSRLTVSDLFASFLAFLPTVWAIVLIGQAIAICLKRIGQWESILELARSCEYIMGLIIFVPIAVLSVFPFVSEIQTRLLFNQAFSRGLDISTILVAKKDTSNKPSVIA